MLSYSIFTTLSIGQVPGRWLAAGSGGAGLSRTSQVGSRGSRRTRDARRHQWPWNQSIIAVQGISSSLVKRRRRQWHICGWLSHRNWYKWGWEHIGLRQWSHYPCSSTGGDPGGCSAAPNGRGGSWTTRRGRHPFWKHVRRCVLSVQGDKDKRF